MQRGLWQQAARVHPSSVPPSPFHRQLSATSTSTNTNTSTSWAASAQHLWPRLPTAAVTPQSPTLPPASTVPLHSFRFHLSVFAYHLFGFPHRFATFFNQGNCTFLLPFTAGAFVCLLPLCALVVFVSHTRTLESTHSHSCFLLLVSMFLQYKCLHVTACVSVCVSVCVCVCVNGKGIAAQFSSSFNSGNCVFKSCIVWESVLSDSGRKKKAKKIRSKKKIDMHHAN